ncbi:hypothetical protein BJV78DRAFT_59867 [Lactifluus subvellereus]|nr:hypothetical protein BJV78DRAFT_59867 [Lactifluus subvellereus]
MTPEQHAQLEAGLDHVRATLGSEEQSGFTDSFIMETLWDCYFDVEKTIEWLNEVQEMKSAARERKEAGIALPDDDLVAKGMSAAQIHAERMVHLAEARSAAGFASFPNDHLPSIQPMEDYNSVSDVDLYVRRLSTITERTERTELTEVPTRSSKSVAFTNRRSLRAPSASQTESSYGEVIGRTKLPIDPNTIRPSPPPSALQPSRDGSEPYDSADDESTHTVTPPQREPSVDVPLLETIPDIPDNQTKSTRSSSLKLYRSNSAKRAIPVDVFKSPASKGSINTVDKPLPDLPPPSEPRYSIAESHASSDHPKKSKLSALASSRVASSKATTISRSSCLSSSTLGTSSVRTYPALRPSSESELSLIEEENPTSSTSSLIRHAIQTALNQEAADRSASSPRKQDKEVQYDSTVTSSSSSKSTAKPTPEVKDGTLTMFYTAADTSAASSSGERSASKLAKLAQAKAKQGSSGVPRSKVVRSPSPSTLLGSTHTEYLTPIANGPTATTAITTSYQSLRHLTSPVLPPSFPPTGYMSSSPSSPEPRPSKLAMKAKKPHHKRVNNPEDEQAYLPVPVHAMFKPEGNRSRASPSAFATILSDGVPLTSDEDKGHRKERRDKLPRDRHRTHSRPKPASPLDDSKASLPKHKSSTAKAANMPLAPLGPFAFDIPSPDDVVLSARRGTSLARPTSGASTLTALPPSTAHSRSSFTSASRVSASAN